MNEKTIKTRYIYKGKILNLRLDSVLLPDGRETPREIVEHPGAAAIVPFLPDGRIIFVKQYRKPVESFVLEIPAGTFKPGEAPSRCARRELEEETGYRAEKMVKLLEYFPSPGYSSERITIFKATGLTKTGMRAEQDEFIHARKINRPTIISLLKQGKIKDGKTIAGLLAVFDIT